MPDPNSGSVTIAGQPILVDYQFQLRKFLDDRLPPDEILFARCMTKRLRENPFVCDNAPDYIDSPYPALPPLSIGEIQWPSGASRYARALYAVDWPTMRGIAMAAWGWSPPTELIDPGGDPDDPDNKREVTPSDVPDDWGVGVNEVPLIIRGIDTQQFQAPMLALRPYRVTGAGVACWLLPLVDKRWLMAQRAFEPLPYKPDDMDVLIASAASAAGTTIVSGTRLINGEPDKRLWGAEQPAVQVLDAACLSSGLRIVRDPVGTLRAVQPTDVRRDATLANDWQVLSGGKRGKAVLPSSVRVHCRKEGDVKFHVEAYSVTGTLPYGPPLAVWSSWLKTSSNASATTAFASAIATNVAAWANCEGQYCLAGPINYLPSGHDDYMSILLEETSAQEYVFRTTIRELPGVFLPRAILLGGGDDDCCDSEDHFLFTLSEYMAGSGADAEIRTMDDTTQIEASATVKNTLGDFSHLGEGDRGICVKVDGVYYAVHPEGAKAGGAVFTLTANLAGAVAASATATVVVSGVDGVSASDSITVYNTGKKKSWTGAIGWAVKIGTQFWVSEIDQYPIRSVVTLSGDTHTFSPYGTYQGKVADQQTPPVSVSAMVATTPYPFAFIPDPLPDITNPLNLIGVSGDRGLVTYNEDEDEFQLVEVYPQEKRRVAFKLTEDMPEVKITSTDKFLPTEAREFTSGEMPFLPSPPTDSIYDPLQLVIDGKENDEGVVEYSYRKARWEVISFRRREFGSLEFEISEIYTKSTGPYTGLTAALVTVKIPPPDRPELLNTEIEIIDHSGCIFDLPEEDLVGVWGWASERIAESLADGAVPGTLTPIHWSADDRCCTESDGTPTPEVSQYSHSQSVAALTWNVAHNLGAQVDSVNVYVGGRLVYASVEIVDSNNLTVTFSQAQTGKVIIEK